MRFSVELRLGLRQPTRPGLKSGRVFRRTLEEEVGDACARGSGGSAG